VSRPQRFIPAAILLILAQAFVWASESPAPGASASPPPANATGASERLSGNLDCILLLDKSLSMAPFFDKVKSYVAGEVLGPILTPGDRLIVELVYGKVERLYSGEIGSEADKAAVIRSLRSVRADGSFTDLGSALDIAARDLDELGRPDRPKYVLLVSDERQEAPAGSKYRVSDYRLRHPSLEYVKRVDHGSFRAITIGLQVGAKVEAVSAEVMKTLSEPPSARSAQAGAATGTGAASTPSDGPAAEGAGSAASGGVGTPGPAAGAGAAARSSPSSAATFGRGIPRYALLIGAVVLALAALVLVLILLRGKRKSEEREGRT